MAALSSSTARDVRPLISRCYYCAGPIHSTMRSGRLVWVCDPCDARVGSLPDGTPLGTPANAQDRDLRQQAHKVFDALWAAKMEREQITQHEARTAAYAWLARTLKIDPALCHMAMMHGAQLQAVIDLCRPYARKLHARPQ